VTLRQPRGSVGRRNKPCCDPWAFCAAAPGRTGRCRCGCSC